MARVRVLVPAYIGNMAPSGAVIDVPDEDLEGMVASGAVEETTDDLGDPPSEDPVEAVAPAPFEGEPEFGPSTENEGGSETNFEPLPVEENEGLTGGMQDNPPAEETPEAVELAEAAAGPQSEDPEESEPEPEPAEPPAESEPAPA
jgi:hypothetical protein